MIRSTSRRIAVGTGMAALIAALGASPAAAGILFGGTGTSDCYGALSVEKVEAGGPYVSTRGKTTTITCTDGDPCDAGACGDGACTFQVAGCINQPGLAGCTPPAALQQFRVKGKLNVKVPSVLQGSACGAFVDGTVQTKKKKKGDKPGKVTLNVLAKAPKGTKPRADTDRFQFVCQPRTTACPTTTTTTTTTTTLGPTVCTLPPFPETPPTTLPPTDGLLDFVVASSAANCGRVTSDDAGTTQIATLQCGGLALGGGKAAAPPEGPTPNGSVNRFGLRNCASDVCEVVATDQSVQTERTLCTNTGCPFGLPLPIYGNPAVCVLNTVAAPASGTVNLATGEADLSMLLSSNTFLTGLLYAVKIGSEEVLQPCPVCVNNLTDLVPQSGTPGDPKTGVCNGGARLGQPCTTQNTDGLTLDCLPGGCSDPANPDCRPDIAGGSCKDSAGNQAGNLGSIPVDLTPLGTAAVSKTAADGRFCPGQTAQSAGCFNAELLTQSANGPNCRGIFLEGQAFGDLRSGSPGTGVLASVFCIPQTSALIINASADLPGPGATSLPGTMTYTPPAP